MFITQFYFTEPKNFKLKTPNKQEICTFNHSSDIDFKYFMNLDKKCTVKPYSLLLIDTNFASDNHLHPRKSLLKNI